MDEVFERLMYQADAGRLGVPPRGVPFPGMYGLTTAELRLGNIIAIATVALKKARQR